LQIDLISFKEFIQQNELAEITNPVIYEKGFIPTSDGILSTEIFGVTTKDRKDTYAYINLNGHFLHPFIYKMLKRMNKNFEALVYGNKRFAIDKDGKLVEDEEGDTGLEFLYKNWAKINFEKNMSRIRNERVDLLNISAKDEIFTEYWVVIPAFYRDMNLQKKSPGHDKINDQYSKLIRMVSLLKNTNNFDFVLEATRGKIQLLLENIYDELKAKIEKKQGIIKKSLLGKSIDYGSRLVISAPRFDANKYQDCLVDFYHVGIPLASCCSMFTPFIIGWVKNYFRQEFERRGNKFPKTDQQGNTTGYFEMKSPELFYTEDYIKKHLDKFVDSYADRFEIVELPPTEDMGKNMILTLTLRGNYYREGEYESASTVFERALTWCDVFYLAATSVTADKHVYVTRYPILDYFGTFPSRIAVMSTHETTSVEIEEKVYSHYPKIDLSMSKEEISTSFIDTVNMSNLYLKGLGGKNIS
jgi:DNA-directed RNA polymerase beta' subunit